MQAFIACNSPKNTPANGRIGIDRRRMTGHGVRLAAIANHIWYGDSAARFLLAPFSLLFSAAAAVRRYGYRNGILKSEKMPVPVVVVGNITVGGAGKTPVTLWLAELLKSSGFQPALISRGYGGRGSNKTLQVRPDSDPDIVGDEPLLLAQRIACPVFVDADRVRAAKTAIGHGADIVISDDGLQHYRLQRDAEIAVVDGARGLGNGYLLPAGPLREPESRLASVDRVLIQLSAGAEQLRYGNRASDRLTTRFGLAGETLRRVSDGAMRKINEFAGESVHAVAGIGNPERFFQLLERNGIEPVRHPLPDHARLTVSDVSFDDDLPVVLTEKDAVKVRAFAHPKLWCLPVDVVFDDGENMRWLETLHAKLRSSVQRASA